MKKVYLDNNATTCVDEKVLEAMLPYLKENYANPSSMYEPARYSAKAIEKSSLGKILSDGENTSRITYGQ